MAIRKLTADFSLERERVEILKQLIPKAVADGKNRKFICVQIPELLPAPEPKLKAIADIAKERIHTASAKIRQERESKLDLDAGRSQDLGFRSYKLDRSNRLSAANLPGCQIRY